MTFIDPDGPAAVSRADLPDLPHDVLLVEDDPLIALDVTDTILGFGVTTVRAARDVAAALQSIAEHAPDFVLLDVGLNHEKSFAVAEQLERRKIPFAFMTGYSGDTGAPASFARFPVLRKPHSADALLETLRAWRNAV